MGEVFFLISDKSEFSCSMFDVITSDKPEKLKKSAKKCRKVRARKFAIPINLYQRLIGTSSLLAWLASFPFHKAPRELYGGGGWARTNDQAVMSRLL